VDGPFEPHDVAGAVVLPVPVKVVGFYLYPLAVPKNFWPALFSQGVVRLYPPKVTQDNCVLFKGGFGDWTPASWIALWRQESDPLVIRVGGAATMV